MRFRFQASRSRVESQGFATAARFQGAEPGRIEEAMV